MAKLDCRLKDQGFSPGSCGLRTDHEKLAACAATLRKYGGKLERLIHALHLSRPENYFSIYQSGCNMSCRKCHSWEFSQVADGIWMPPDDILGYAIAYEKKVTLWERRQNATAWHAQESCRCCGACALYGKRSAQCPGVLPRESVVLSPQGFGPARNILAFTGGDLMCRPDRPGDSIYHPRLLPGIQDEGIPVSNGCRNGRCLRAGYGSRSNQGAAGKPRAVRSDG